ncbi:UNVERIFIED_CONTAM: hypothetical protein NCL1_45442 [Trichonephila clavipes]
MFSKPQVERKVSNSRTQSACLGFRATDFSVTETTLVGNGLQCLKRIKRRRYLISKYTFRWERSYRCNQFSRRSSDADCGAVGTGFESRRRNV